jgi:hypothetical protein
MEMGKAAAVVLAVNGKRYEAAGVDPSTTLLEFLRTHTPVRGPKLGCGEGKYVARPSGRHTFCLCLCGLAVAARERIFVCLSVRRGEHTTVRSFHET